MKIYTLALTTFCITTALLSPSRAGEKCLVVGDSLTKEYQAEFPALYPDRPAAWSARNWAEILDSRRNTHFDLGSFATYTDLRLTGHEYNWAKPGATVREFRNFLRQDAAAEAEISVGNGAALWPFFPSWRDTFRNSVSLADRVVVFFGGNDLASGNSDPEANPVVGGQTRQVTYKSIYDANLGEGSNPDLLRASIRKNIKSVVEWFRNPASNGGTARFSGPMVLCAAPHVGCTPKIRAEVGTGPSRTAVITQMLETLNIELQSLASTWNMGFADTYAVTKRVLDPAPFEIGGVTFFKTADADCRTRYLFSGDGFHPNTAAQAEMAQAVADAFLRTFPTSSGFSRLKDREIITTVLGLPADTGFKDWLDAAGVTASQQGPYDDPDKDGVPNVLEYALTGKSPAIKDAGSPLSISLTGVGPARQVQISWQPRFAENAYADLKLEYATGLSGWLPVSTTAVTTASDGRSQATLSLTAAKRFYRLRATVIP